MKKHDVEVFAPPNNAYETNPVNFGIGTIIASGFGGIFLNALLWGIHDVLTYILVSIMVVGILTGIFIIRKAIAHAEYGMDRKMRYIYGLYRELTPESQSQINLTPDTLFEFPYERYSELERAMEDLKRKDKMRREEEARLSPVAESLLGEIKNATEYNKTYIENIKKVMGDKTPPTQSSPPSKWWEVKLARLGR